MPVLTGAGLDFAYGAKMADSFRPCQNLHFSQILGFSKIPFQHILQAENSRYSFAYSNHEPGAPDKSFILKCQSSINPEAISSA